MPTLEDAILLAAQAHRGQKDKNGDPYILHPLRVLLRLTTERERIVGALHDVVEDTEITLDDLRAHGYPEDIVAAVGSISRRPGETYEQFVERAAANPLARSVKLADLEDNMDLRRLRAVTTKDAERLDRYVRAWRMLSGRAGQADDAP